MGKNKKKAKKMDDPDIEKLDSSLEESFESGITNEEEVGIVTDINNSVEINS